MSEDRKDKKEEKDYTGSTMKIERGRVLEHVDNISKAKKEKPK
jgi:hypothetical protein